MLPGEPRIVRFLDTVWADRHGPHDDLDTAVEGGPVAGRAGLSSGSDRSLMTTQRSCASSATRSAGSPATTPRDDRERAESPLSLEAAVKTVNRHASRPAAGPTVIVDGESTFRYGTCRATEIRRAAHPDRTRRHRRDDAEQAARATRLPGSLVRSLLRAGPPPARLVLADLRQPRAGRPPLCAQQEALTRPRAVGPGRDPQDRDRAPDRARARGRHRSRVAGQGCCSGRRCPCHESSRSVNEYPPQTRAIVTLR